MVGEIRMFISALTLRLVKHKKPEFSSCSIGINPFRSVGLVSGATVNKQSVFIWSG